MECVGTWYYTCMGEMYFDGKVRWSEQEEQELAQEACEFIRANAREYSERIRQLRSSKDPIMIAIASEMKRQLGHLEMEVAPFFGRVDVSFDRKSVEPRYIGYVGVELGGVRILDWRAPLSSIYYSEKLGEKTYSVEGKGRTVYQTLRRRFSQEKPCTIVSTEHLELPIYPVTVVSPDTNRQSAEAKEEKVADIKYDEYLEQLLSRPSEGIMRDIVRTIAAEQDGIIRSSEKNIFIIGGPGTGKTSVVLHRIAVLAYQAQQSKQSQRLRYAYLTPTAILGYYSSGVFTQQLLDAMPDFWSIDRFLDHQLQDFWGIFFNTPYLSETKLKFEERNLYFDHPFRNELKEIHNSKNFLDAFEVAASRTALEIVANRLSSPRFYRIKERMMSLRKKVDTLRQHLRTAKYRSQEAYSRSEAAQRSLAQIGDIAYRAVDLIDDAQKGSISTTKHLSLYSIKHMRHGIQRLRKIDGQIRNLAKQILDDDNDKRFKSIMEEFIQELNLYIRDVEQLLLAINPFILFREVWNSELLRSLESEFGLSPTGYSYLFSLRQGSPYFLRYDEKVLFLLLLYSLFGNSISPLLKYDVVAIDEIQNMPLSLMRVVDRAVSKKSRLILSADLNQRTSSLIPEKTEPLPFSETITYELSKSYRSNPYIIKAATYFLENSIDLNIQLVRKEGKIPEVLSCEIEALLDNLSKSDAKYQSVAFITKSLDSAISIGERLGIRVVEDDSPAEGLLIGKFAIPLSLCAGLEFDVVILYDVSDTTYNLDNPADLRLFYVAATRAMHQLFLHRYPHSQSSIIDALLQSGLAVENTL